MTTPPLSRAAQTLMDAIDAQDGNSFVDVGVAVLIAAADEVVPETGQPELHGSRTCSTAWQRWDERSAIRTQLLSLAAELRREGQA
jgi:hypothetical protein